MGGMVNLTPFSLLTAIISLSQFISFLFKSWKQYRGVFLLLFEQMGMEKNNFVVLSHSLLLKLTQL